MSIQDIENWDRLLEEHNEIWWHDVEALNEDIRDFFEWTNLEWEYESIDRSDSQSVESFREQLESSSDFNSREKEMLDNLIEKLYNIDEIIAEEQEDAIWQIKTDLDRIEFFSSSHSWRSEYFDEMEYFRIQIDRIDREDISQEEFENAMLRISESILERPSDYHNVREIFSQQDLDPVILDVNLASNIIPREMAVNMDIEQLNHENIIDEIQAHWDVYSRLDITGKHDEISNILLSIFWDKESILEYIIGIQEIEESRYQSLREKWYSGHIWEGDIHWALSTVFADAFSTLWISESDSTARTATNLTLVGGGLFVGYKAIKWLFWSNWNPWRVIWSLALWVWALAAVWGVSRRSSGDDAPTRQEMMERFSSSEMREGHASIAESVFGSFSAADIIENYVHTENDRWHSMNLDSLIDSLTDAQKENLRQVIVWYSSEDIDEEDDLDTLIQENQEQISDLLLTSLRTVWVTEESYYTDSEIHWKEITEFVDDFREEQRDWERQNEIREQNVQRLYDCIERNNVELSTREQQDLDELIQAYRTFNITGSQFLSRVNELGIPEIRIEWSLNS